MRPSILKDKKEDFLKAIRLGVSYESACAYCGIGESTFYSWQKKGEEGGSKNKQYVEFVEELKKAQSESEVRNVAIIQDAAKKQWQAAAWLLERRLPQKWGKLDKVALTDPSGENEFTGIKEARQEAVDRLDRILAGIKSNGHTGGNGKSSGVGAASEE